MKRRGRQLLVITVVAIIFIGSLTGFYLLRHKNTDVTFSASGTSTHSITVDGLTRSYRVYRPASISKTTPAPLVVMLHGALGSGKQAEDSYGWDQQADQGKFVVAYPDGIKRSWAVSDDCCGPPASTHVNDAEFITQMIQSISDNLTINKSRIYATGISNGGALAYRLACDTNIFAAIGPDSTTLLGDCPSPDPISVLHIHGTADQTFPYNGGSGKRNNTGNGRYPVNTTGPAIRDLIAMWQKTDHCEPPTTQTHGLVTTSIAQCPGKRSVGLISIRDAGHQWPGGKSNTAIQNAIGLDPPSTALDATSVLWDFFAQHQKND